MGRHGGDDDELVAEPGSPPPPAAERELSPGSGTEPAAEPEVSRRRRGVAPVAAVLLVVLVIVAVGLGIWWWKLKSPVDPISADPVSADAVVVTSPSSCGNGQQITIKITGTSSTSQLDACGNYSVDQHLTVEYLAGHPERARVAGTTTAGPSSGASRWLPIGILIAGVLAIGATVVLIADRRRPATAVPAGRSDVPVGPLTETAALPTDSAERSGPTSTNGPADANTPAVSVWDLRQSILGSAEPAVGGGRRATHSSTESENRPGEPVAQIGERAGQIAAPGPPEGDNSDG